jgi:ribosomal protein L34E
VCDTLGGLKTLAERQRVTKTKKRPLRPLSVALCQADVARASAPVFVNMNLLDGLIIGTSGVWVVP